MRAFYAGQRFGSRTIHATMGAEDEPMTACRATHTALAGALLLVVSASAGAAPDPCAATPFPGRKLVTEYSEPCPSGRRNLNESSLPDVYLSAGRLTKRGR